MDKSDIFRHAVNIADFFKVVGEFVTQGSWPEEQDTPSRRYRSIDEFHRNHDEFGDPVDLGDLGLDDMSLSRVVVELSQTREHFKIWTPFNEDFRIAIKECIPPHGRRWDPDERCWRVDCYWFGNAQELLPKHFPTLERYYTSRAIKMCERLASGDEDEQVSRKKSKTRREKKKVPPKNNKKSEATCTDNGSSKKPPPNSSKSHHGRDSANEDRHHSEDDPYEILGVSRKAPEEVIKAAHKALARKYHTDATGKAGDDKDMKRVNAAFERIKEMRKWNTT